MALSRTQVIIIGAVAFIIILIIGIFVVGGRQTQKKPPKIELTVWGIDDRRAFTENLDSYEALRTNVQVNYQEMDPATYEVDLLNALAAGNGPDVLMFKNTWLPKHYNKIRAVGDSQFNLAQLQQLFPTVVEQDFAPDGLIFALPLNIDTLALYYNTDIFNTIGIAFPPTTWIDFQNLIPKLRQMDAKKNIIRAAAAVGGSNQSIDVASDILSLLMLQAGTEMTNEDFSQATFARYVESEYPGEIALAFYTKFADPTNTYYTWNDFLGSSLNNFSQGKTAVIFDYGSQKENLKTLNPFLKFRISPMLQPNIYETAVNYATYWGLAVSNQSANPEWAWDLAIYLTTNDSAADSYITKSGKSPALRTLIQKYINDPEIGVFAKQALSARTWPKIDEKAVDNIFSQMIIAVNNKQLETDMALRQAETAVTDLISAQR